MAELVLDVVRELVCLLDGEGALDADGEFGVEAVPDPAHAQVRDVVHAGNSARGALGEFDGGGLDAVHEPAEDFFGRVAQDEQDGDGDDETEDRVCGGEAERDGAEDDGEGGEAVGAGVQAVGDEGSRPDLAADGDAVAGDEFVAREADEPGERDDPQMLDRVWVQQSLDRLVGGECGGGGDDQDDHDSGEAFGAAETVGVAASCGAPAEQERQPDRQREKIDAMFRQPHPEGPPPSVEALRAGFATLMSRMIVPSGIRTCTTTLGDRQALYVEPEQGVRPETILYFHGGGWVFGSPQTALSLTANLVVRTGCRAFSVDYRLAPEHPFPAGIDDALGAYRALLDNGVDSSTIVFAGDSGGGGLTVTTSLAARDAGLPLPAAIVAFSPGLDATRTGESMDTKASVDPIFTRAGLERTGAMYTAGQDPRQPLLSPAVMADLTGFPPILLQVGNQRGQRLRLKGADFFADFVVGDLNGEQRSYLSGFGGGVAEPAADDLDGDAGVDELDGVGVAQLVDVAAGDGSVGRDCATRSEDPVSGEHRAVPWVCRR